MVGVNRMQDEKETFLAPTKQKNPMGEFSLVYLSLFIGKGRELIVACGFSWLICMELFNYYMGIVLFEDIFK